MNKAIFLDRDGVINEEVGYILEWGQFKFIPGFLESLVKINESGYLVIIVSNQSCINKGLLSRSQLDIIHTKMLDEISISGGTIDAIFYCVHTAQEDCDCKKPRPGLLLEAKELYNIDLENSYIIGDKDIDVIAGKKVGCKTILLTKNQEVGEKPDFTASSWIDILKYLNL
jgi:D,D-heptose 1,7-bisphosphate phosphatase